MFGDSDAQRHDDRADERADDHEARLDGTDGTTSDAVPVGPTPPVTGDEAVDEAMTRLAQAQSGSFAERIESGEHAHRSLQSRLGGLGGA